MHTTRAQIRVYKARSGPDTSVYADLSDMVDGSDGGRPIIHRAVNREGDFSFALTVGDGQKNPILKTFGGWSDGSTGAIAWGMYITIRDISTMKLMVDGIISTLRLQEHVLQVECADWMSVLGSQGGEIRRNYYANSADLATDVEWNADDGTIRSTYPSGYMPMSETLRYLVHTPIDRFRAFGSNTDAYDMDDYSYLLYSREGSVGNMYPVYHTVTWNVDTGGSTHLRRITNMETFKICSLGAVAFDAVLTVTVNGVSRDVPFSNRGFGVWRIDGLSAYFGSPGVDISNGCTITFTISLSTEASNLTAVYITGGVNTAEGETVNGSSGSISCKLETYTATGVDASASTTQIIISHVGNQTVTESYLEPDRTDRVLASYSVGRISTTEIMENIAIRCGMEYYGPGALPSSESTLAQFQTGGGFALDYLTLLAEIVNLDGGKRKRTFSATGQNPVLNVGARRMSTDDPNHRTVYGMVDTSDQSVCDCIMYSFKPVLTMKNRPSRAVYRGEMSSLGGGSDGYVILVVSNPTVAESRGGLETDTLISSSGVADVGSAAVAAWTEISDDGQLWEGELTLSGIIPDMIDFDGSYAGSGKVIEVKHPLSMSVDEGETMRFVVSEVVYDYNQFTTRLTLTNKGMRYDSAIPDTVALSIQTSSQVATGSESLSKTQFVRIVTDTAVALGDEISVVGYTSNGDRIMLQDVTRLNFPSGRTIICATAPPTGGTGYTTDLYDVVAIAVDGTRFEIPEYERPDYRPGQTLIVNIDMPTPS